MSKPTPTPRNIATVQYKQNNIPTETFEPELEDEQPIEMQTRVENSMDVLLDPADPFEAAVIDIVKMNRKKRSDYAIDGDPFSNFEMSSSMLGVENFHVTESILFNMAQKFARLNSLRRNGRMAEASNESVNDTYLDLSVYGCILYAWVRINIKR